MDADLPNSVSKDGLNVNNNYGQINYGENEDSINAKQTIINQKYFISEGVNVGAVGDGATFKNKEMK